MEEGRVIEVTPLDKALSTRKNSEGFQVLCAGRVVTVCGTRAQADAIKAMAFLLRSDMTKEEYDRIGSHNLIAHAIKQVRYIRKMGYYAN